MTKPVNSLSLDCRPIKVDLLRSTVSLVSRVANREFKYFFDLSGHALSRYMCEFLVRRIPNMPASTVVSYCYACSRLLDFSKETGYETLSAESFGAFTDWLKDAKSLHTQEHFSENTRRGYANFVLKFMEALVDVDVIRTREVDISRLRHQKALRGSSSRQIERMRLSAVSPENYASLIRAIRMEYEECLALLTQPRRIQDKYDQTFPLLPFTMQLGAELAVRSVEFNYLAVSDLKDNRLFLNPPNKESSEILLPPNVMAALSLAQNWMSLYRRNAAPSEPLLTTVLIKGPRHHEVVRFDTILVFNSLRKFYKKYFDLIDPDGMPYLYSISPDDESELIPFSLPFSDFRSAAITDAARHESNPEVVRRFARHKYFTTTLKYYIREIHQRWVGNIALFLAPSAERMRIYLKNKIASPNEEKKARAAGASVPGGHCEPAVSGDRSCRRASDCRLCEFFRIHVSRRDFFVMERDEAVEKAKLAQSEQGLLRDAENLREFAALNQSIIDRIDDHLGR